MIKAVYEGDTILIKIDLSDHNLPLNPNLTFAVDIGDGQIIKKPIDVGGTVTFYEKDTLGLDGIYPCEIRLNNKGMTKVLFQDVIEIRNSITVSGEPICQSGESSSGEVTDEVNDIVAISNKEIEVLF